MQLPEEILNKIIELSFNMNKKEIAENFRKISDKYIGEKKGESLLNKDNEAIAYAIARMPATYGAVRTAIEQVLEIASMSESKSLIDVGAGTGAATLAVMDSISPNTINKITCLEREEVMMSLGKMLFAESNNDIVKEASWIEYDINAPSKSKIDNCNDGQNIELKADIVITSYMLNEFADDKVLDVVDKLWNMTNNILLIVDPGTPKDHKRLIKIKNYLSSKGGEILAPCTCSNDCPLPETDWCHFLCRVERTRMQKQVKGAEVPYEDEKFTYLAISKAGNFKNMGARIIRHPIVRSNMVEVKLCSDGEIISKIYTKKDKEIYKFLKKAKVGELVEINK